MPKQFYKVKDYRSRRSIGYLLRLAGKLITQRMETLFDGEDFNFVQWVILMNLREGIAATANELSQRMCHDAGAMTRTLDQMEAGGLINRTRSTTDRRIVELELTKGGEKVCAQFLPRVVDFYNEIFDDFTNEEAEKTIELLSRLTAKLGATDKER